MFEYKASIARAGESSIQKKNSEIKVNILLNNIESLKFGQWRNSSNDNAFGLKDIDFQKIFSAFTGIWSH